MSRDLRSAFSLLLGSALFIAVQSSAQTNVLAEKAFCANAQTQIGLLSAQLGQTALWDDARIARARTSLAKLQQSRLTLVRLTRRLNGAEQSAANAEAFDKSGEANFWRRNTEQVRELINTERKKSKGWTADAGVSCPGCTYSVVIAKVKAAIDGAVAARASAFEVQQQIASYKSKMAAAGCQD